MHRFLMIAVGLAAAGLATAGNAPGDDHVPVPPIPDKPVDEQFQDVPSPWRAYLVAARAAERIEDPLQRCLAYPDLPGNDWPDGHAAAHCRVHQVSPLTMAELSGYVDEDGLDALHARLDAALARHFSEDDFGEDIHYLLDGFGAIGGEGDRLTAKWLELAPGSAYAHHARGVFLLGAAAKARGGRYAHLTPPEAMREMSRLVDQSVQRLQQAVDIEPRLMPAYAMLIHAAMLDSRGDLERRASEKAWSIDPACLDVAKQRMQALQPRWGGSQEAMIALARKLEPLARRRPGLAVHLGAPWGDLGDRLKAEDAYTLETAGILDVAVARGSNEAYLEDAADVARHLTDAPPDQWKALAYLLQAARFREGSAWAERTIAASLVRVEPEWSLAHAYRALPKATPGDVPTVHYYLGAGHYNSGNAVEAERHYLLAAKDPDILPTALAELAEMWLFHDPADPEAGAARAEPHIDRLLAAEPASAMGMLLRLQQLSVQGRPITADLLRRFIEHADRDDPRQREALTRVEPLLDALERAIEAGPPGQ